jgi:hypothetical protein
MSPKFLNLVLPLFIKYVIIKHTVCTIRWKRLNVHIQIYFCRYVYLQTEIIHFIKMSSFMIIFHTPTMYIKQIF